MISAYVRYGCIIALGTVFLSVIDSYVLTIVAGIICAIKL